MKAPILKPLLLLFVKSVRNKQLWTSGYVHLTGTIIARYTPDVIVPVPEARDTRASR